MALFGSLDFFVYLCSMKRNRGIRYRFYPTDEQVKVLNNMFAARRVYWNIILEMYNERCAYNRTVEKPEDKIPYILCIGGRKPGTTPMPNNEVYHVSKAVEYANAKAEDGKDYSWLLKHKGVCECTITDLYKSWNRFYDYLKDLSQGKRSNKVGAPRAKKRHDVNSVTLRNTQLIADGKKMIDWKRGLVQTPGFMKLGLCKCVLHRRFKGNIKYSTITKENDGKWYISLSIEEEVPEVKLPTNVKPENVVGIDLGLKTEAVIANAVDGDDSFHNSNPTRLMEELSYLDKKIRRIQRAMTRCIVTMTREGAESRIMTVTEMNKREQENKRAFSGYHKTYSNGYNKLLEKKNKIEAHIRRKREDYNHNLTNAIVSDPNVELIGMEDLAIQEMMMRNKTKVEHGIKVKEDGGKIVKPRRKMAKHFGDLALADITRMIEYKAAQRGKGFCKVDRYYPSSKTCSKCGHKYTGLTLSQRTWVCPVCGGKLKRDANAAKNIAKEALKIYNEQQSV